MFFQTDDQGPLILFNFSQSYKCSRLQCQLFQQRVDGEPMDETPMMEAISVKLHNLRHDPWMEGTESLRPSAPNLIRFADVNVYSTLRNLFKRLRINSRHLSKQRFPAEDPKEVPIIFNTELADLHQ